MFLVRLFVALPLWAWRKAREILGVLASLREFDTWVYLFRTAAPAFSGVGAVVGVVVGLVLVVAGYVPIGGASFGGAAVLAGSCAALTRWGPSWDIAQEARWWMAPEPPHWVDPDPRYPHALADVAEHTRAHRARLEMK